jgi:hypothetical protein
MTAWLSILISGVLLNHMDAPMPVYHLTFISESGELIEAINTDKDGKFQVDLAPGTYRVLMGFDRTVESITVDKSTSKLRLHKPPLPEPHVIETIRDTQRGDPVIEAPVPEHRWYFDIPLHSNPLA